MKKVLVSLLVLGLSPAGVAVAADCPNDAAEILDAFVEATGGRAAYEKVENRVMRSVLEIPAAGFEIPVVVYLARPAKFYSISETEAIGKIERGTDGEVAWENSLMGGAQILEGEQAEFLLRSAFLDSVANWRQIFADVVCDGVEQVEGRSAFRVELAGKIGPPETRFYDVESGLVVKTAMTLELPQGEIPIETFPTDYRSVDGIVVAHTIRTVLLGQERTVHVESIEHNVDLPDGRFDLPDEIRDLLQPATR